MVPDLDSLTSIYDRWVHEVAKLQKGGQVDNVKGHSTACGHSQFTSKVGTSNSLLNMKL
ncbi:hypothetical protein Sjap_007212 [Stephania japonica]|uniref:Uncharacterized protein n=1 Tax=Stephania japonica TaxID=461633 RepID=A0AAP0JM78_9MAGN